MDDKKAQEHRLKQPKKGLNTDPDNPDSGE